MTKFAPNPLSLLEKSRRPIFLKSSKQVQSFRAAVVLRWQEFSGGEALRASDGASFKSLAASRQPAIL